MHGTAQIYVESTMHAGRRVDRQARRGDAWGSDERKRHRRSTMDPQLPLCIDARRLQDYQLDSSHPSVPTHPDDIYDRMLVPVENPWRLVPRIPAPAQRERMAQVYSTRICEVSEYMGLGAPDALVHAQGIPLEFPAWAQHS